MKIREVKKTLPEGLDLKVSFKDGQIQEHGDDEVTRRIVKIKNELMDLEEDHI